MKPTLTIVSALIAGFVGGMLGSRMPRGGEQRPPQLVRARSFELVNEAGQAISYWGIDKGGNLVLTFGTRGAFEGSALLGRPVVDLKDIDNQLTAIGLQGNDMPLLKMHGADGKTRVRLLLSPDSKPTLTMEDETGPRVSLGIEQSDTPGPDDNDWSLVFGPNYIARIGLHSEKREGHTYVQGGVYINKEKVEYPYRQPNSQAK
jgi:hypothetical protein